MAPGIFMPFLQENIFQDKQHCQYIHQSADLLFFCLTCDQVDGYLCDNSHGDTFGNAVEERHCDDAEECRKSFCRILKVDLRYRTDHIEAYGDQSRSRREGRDRKKDRGQK